MRIVVNHVTRMSSPRICVAGIDPETIKHVRPTTPQTDPITRNLLREEGGPFGMGAVVDLGATVPEPTSPETRTISSGPPTRVTSRIWRATSFSSFSTL
jgi:hypothetical protein